MSQKKKFTLIATEEGVAKAEKALIRMSFGSQSNFANAILMSRSTVSKFFNRKPIQLDSFKRICEQLGGLKWQEIAGISQSRQSSESERKDMAVAEVGGGAAPQRLVTVSDPKTKLKKVVITLQGDIESVTNLQILQAILREHSGDTIEI